MRVDLLSPTDQPEMRQMFREYVDSRLAIYRKLPDVAAALVELQRSGGLQTRIWTRAVAGTKVPDAHPNAALLLLPALNQMSTSRPHARWPRGRTRPL